MAARIAHASFLLSKEHAAVLMSLHPGNALRAKKLVAGVQPELAHAARGLLAGGWQGAGSSGG
jgi:hypothetical protein